MIHELAIDICRAFDDVEGMETGEPIFSEWVKQTEISLWNTELRETLKRNIHDMIMDGEMQFVPLYHRVAKIKH